MGNITGHIANDYYQNSDNIFSSFLGQRLSSDGGAIPDFYGVKVLGIAYVSYRMKDIHAILRSANITEEKIDEALELGKKAFNVAYLVVGSEYISPYLTVMTHELPALAKEYMSRTGENSMFHMSGQLFEKVNQMGKNWEQLKSPHKKGEGPQGRSRRPFTFNYVHCVEAFRHPTMINTTLEAQRAIKRSTRVKNATGCEDCNGDLDNNGACSSKVCHNRFWSEVCKVAEESKLTKIISDTFKEEEKRLKRSAPESENREAEKARSRRKVSKAKRENRGKRTVRARKRVRREHCND